MTDRAYDCLRLDFADGVGEITLDMPQYGNALTVAGIQEFLDALLECGRRDDVGAVQVDGFIAIRPVDSRAQVQQPQTGIPRPAFRHRVNVAVV